MKVERMKRVCLFGENTTYNNLSIVFVIKWNVKKDFDQENKLIFSYTYNFLDLALVEKKGWK